MGSMYICMNSASQRAKTATTFIILPRENQQLCGTVMDSIKYVRAAQFFIALVFESSQIYQVEN